MAFDLSNLGNVLNSLASYYNATSAADAQAANAANAASMAQFRPVGLTSRFGTAGYNYDPTTGAMSGAGYMLAPDIAAQREAMINLGANQLQQAQAAQAFQPQTNIAATGLFNLGKDYVAETPQQAAQNWMTQQQAVLAPGREQEQAQLLNKLNRMGTMGLATGATEAGGMAATNPLMAAYQNRKMQEDLQLAAQAQQAGQQQAQFGQGLMTGALNLAGGGYGLQQQALNPYISYMNQAKTLEALGQEPLTTSSNLGAQALTGQQTASSLTAKGGSAAIDANQAAINAVLKGLLG